MFRFVVNCETSLRQDIEADELSRPSPIDRTEAVIPDLAVKNI
jgi:hypothetical protein